MVDETTQLIIMWILFTGYGTILTAILIAYIVKLRG